MNTSISWIDAVYSSFLRCSHSCRFQPTTILIDPLLTGSHPFPLPCPTFWPGSTEASPIEVVRGLSPVNSLPLRSPLPLVSLPRHPRF